MCTRERRTIPATGRLSASGLVVPVSWKLRHWGACTPHSDSNFSNKFSPSSSSLARSSLYEAQAALRVAAAWGFVEKHQAAVVVHALDRLGARVFGLSRR